MSLTLKIIRTLKWILYKTQSDHTNSRERENVQAKNKSALKLKMTDENQNHLNLSKYIIEKDRKTK